MVSALQEYYASYVPASGITTDLAVPAEHCMPTISYGEACLELVSPYIGRCEVDGAGRALTALLGPQLQAPATAVTPARLMAFDQTRYYSGGRTSLDSAGFVYVPARCQDGETSCRLHVSFHGQCAKHGVHSCVCPMVCGVVWCVSMIAAVASLFLSDVNGNVRACFAGRLSAGQEFRG